MPHIGIVLSQVRPIWILEQEIVYEPYDFKKLAMVPYPLLFLCFSVPHIKDQSYVIKHSF